MSSEAVHRSAPGWSLALLLSLLAVPSLLAGQEGQQVELTVEQIYGSPAFSAERLDATWRADGESWVVVERNEDGQNELWEVDAATGEPEKLAAADELVPEGGSEVVTIYDFSFGPRGRYLLLFTDAQRVWRRRSKGKYYLFDLEESSLRPLSERSGWQWFAKFSPDGTRVAFGREHDLFVVDVETGEERRLTSSGGQDTLNGISDWVYEEELGLRDAFRWSPDGRRIAYWQFDRSPIPLFYLIDQTRLYPRLKGVHYPKAGTENSRVRVGSLNLETGETTWFDTGSLEYLPRMQWVTEDRVAIQRMNRLQNRLEVLLGDPATGETRRILTDRDSAWVNVDGHLTWIDGGDRFVWSSQRDGYLHLYLHERDGELVRQLTEGAWPVTDLLGVDEERGRVWFQAARPGSLTRSVGWVPLGGGRARWVVGPAASDCGAGAPGRAGGADAAPGTGGVHSADFSPDYRYFFHTGSSAGTPPVTVLRRADGAAVRTLVDNRELKQRIAKLDLRRPEFTSVEAADGTPLNAWMIRPSSFDSTRAHPLLLYVYGGPGVQTVMDRWGGRRYLWHQLLARKKGVLVASVDNRGTGGRGRDFTKQVYLRLGQLESADQLAVVRQMGERPYVDADRIGIWGWSYGGYLTLLSTLRSDGAIAAGISVAPVTHWKFYDTIYTERYMRTPSENPDGYREGSPLQYASRLRSELLIVHGTGDDNVHPQNTIRMVRALERANKQFRMRIYPNKRHGIGGVRSRVNLFGMMTEFLEEELAGAR